MLVSLACWCALSQRSSSSPQYKISSVQVRTLSASSKLFFVCSIMQCCTVGKTVVDEVTSTRLFAFKTITSFRVTCVWCVIWSSTVILSDIVAETEE